MPEKPKTLFSPPNELQNNNEGRALLVHACLACLYFHEHLARLGRWGARSGTYLLIRTLCSVLPTYYY